MVLNLLPDAWLVLFIAAGAAFSLLTAKLLGGLVADTGRYVVALIRYLRIVPRLRALLLDLVAPIWARRIWIGYLMVLLWPCRPKPRHRGPYRGRHLAGRPRAGLIGPAGPEDEQPAPAPAAPVDVPTQQLVTV